MKKRSLIIIAAAITIVLAAFAAYAVTNQAAPANKTCASNCANFTDANKDGVCDVAAKCMKDGKCDPSKCPPGKCDPSKCAMSQGAAGKCDPAKYTGGKCDPSKCTMSQGASGKCDPAKCTGGKCDPSKCTMSQGAAGKCDPSKCTGGQGAKATGASCPGRK